MRKKKIITLILTLSLVIIIGSLLGTYMYLKYVPISNLKGFKDDFYGYSIKYPKGWFIYPDEIHKFGYSTDITSFDLSLYIDKQNTGSSTWQLTPNGELSIHISVDNMGDSKSLDDWIIKNPPPIGNVVSQDNRVIDGVNSIMQTTSDLGLIVYIPKNKQVFIIQAEPLESLGKMYNETFNMILSTFKFTK